MEKKYSIVIPAYNEEGGVAQVLEELLSLTPKDSFEIVVVDDCSRDSTAAVVASYPVVLKKNIQNFGYGYSLKQGIVAATHPNIIILDADGSYPPLELHKLIAEYEKGFDMVVGARQGRHYYSSVTKRIARFFFRVLSEFTTGRKIPDINSGCRIFRKNDATRFFHTLSSGFSFTTTITLAFMLNSLSVVYLPINYQKRSGKSKVKYVRDTLRSLQIIVQAIVSYNPLKAFLMCGIMVFIVGIICALLSLWFPLQAVLLFAAFSTAMLICSVGLIAVQLRFMHNDAS